MPLLPFANAPGAGGTQSNQNLSIYALGNTTQNSSTLLNASNLSLNGLGNVTVGFSNGSIQISDSQSKANVSLYALGNTTQNSSTVLNESNLSFNGLGINTIGFSNGSIQVSATTPVQSNQNVSLYALGNTTQNSSTLLNASNLSFNAIGNMSVGFSNGSIQLSDNTNQPMTVYAVSNTTQSTSMTANASNLSFAGAGIASVGATNGSVLISVPSGGGAGDGVNIIAAGTQTANTTGTVVFSNSNNVSFGMSNSSIVTASASYAAQTNQTMGLYALGNTTQNSSTTLDARTMSYNALGAMTWGYSNGSIQVSAPATSSLAVTGAISISSVGSTVSISVPSQTTLYRWEQPEDAFLSIAQTVQGSLSVQHMYVPFNVSATAAMIVGSLSALTSTSATTASANNSLWMGIYTNNASTLSLASSGSANNAFVWSQSASTTGNTSVNSMRQMTVPMNVNMTPGEYWVAAVISQATTYTGFSFIMYGNSNITAGATNVQYAPIGSNTSVGRPVYMQEGMFSVTTAAGPVSIGTSGINYTSASNVQRANIYVQLYNATY